MKVTLVGAGPSDFELLTIKALNAINKADIILYDRLVSDEILSMIPEHIEKINIGKESNNHSIPQSEINNLLLRKVQEGLNVVRLKGGDPFVFGRGGEELELLSENNIDFEVIPGISSSIAGATYAGIPVTHRDFASSLHIITGHAKQNEKLKIDFNSLVKLNGTIIFMMSIGNLNKICEGCLSAGIDKNMPTAIIENATSTKQRKFIGTISTIEKIILDNKITSPSIIIVGKVCSLSEKFDWFMKKPLLGKKIIVTQAKNNISTLKTQLKNLGADVIEMPCIKTIPLIEGNAKLHESIKNIKNYNWLVFTSPTGVNIFFDYLIEKHFDIRNLINIKIAAVGIKTKKEIIKRGLSVDYFPEEYNGLTLGNGLIKKLNKNDKVLLLRSKIGSNNILKILDKNNIRFENVSIYTTSNENENSDYIKELIEKNKIDYVTFTSSSTVEGFIKSIPTLDCKKINAICIGEKTAETAEKFGIKYIISDESTIESIVKKLKEISKNDVK